VVWTIYGRLSLKSQWLCKIPVPLAHVGMKARDSLWDRIASPVVSIVSVFICDKRGVVLRVVYVHDGNVIL
jgi:hypothetical protein